VTLTVLVGCEVLVAACYLAFFYLAYVRPLGDHLALHEKGMRVRLGFRRLAVPFGSMERLYLGRVPSTVEAGLRRALSLLKPDQAARIASLDGTALTVVTAGGRAHVFKALLTLFEPADLERFFLEVVGRNPRLGVQSAGDEAPA
jgi:hypothetical protein